MFIIDRAEMPSSPSSPQLSRALILSFGLGLGAGFSPLTLIERLDDTIHSANEMERMSGLVTLGTYPKVPTGTLPEVELNNSRSALSEAYRSLCTSLQFSTETGLPKTLLITSSGPGEGKSLTSLAIARAFLTMGLKVLVIDADLRNASLHKKLQLTIPSVSPRTIANPACTPPEAFQAIFRT